MNHFTQTERIAPREETLKMLRAFARLYTPEMQETPCTLAAAISATDGKGVAQC